MTVKIHGKDYKTVAERVNEIHKATKGRVDIITNLISWEEGVVIMHARVIVYGEGDQSNTYTGYAYENEGSTQINKTSALENCVTSAIGRALAAAGYAGSEYASANEVENAVQQQGQKIDAGGDVRARPATKKQKGLIWHLAEEHLPDGDEDGRKAYLEMLIKADHACPVVANSLSSLTSKQASDLIEYLQNTNGSK